jgi:hypothetical protein
MCAACFTIAQVVPISAGVARAHLVARRRRRARVEVEPVAEEAAEQVDAASDRAPDLSAARA